MCWTETEDHNLVKAVEKKGGIQINWKEVALEVPERTPRQCRERWKTKFTQEWQNSKLSPDEKELLNQRHEQCGSDWKALAQHNPSCSQNSIKHYFLAEKPKETFYQSSRDANLNAPCGFASETTQVLDFDTLNSILFGFPS